MKIYLWKGNVLSAIFFSGDIAYDQKIQELKLYNLQKGTGVYFVYQELWKHREAEV